MLHNDTYARGCDVNEFKDNPDKNNCSGTCGKLNVHDWLKDIPASNSQKNEYVEIRFKNTRKDFFVNVNKLQLTKGDIVAVEASPGHDIGIVSYTGNLVEYKLQKERRKVEELKKVYRHAKSTDIEKWIEAIDLEIPTMLKARLFAKDLKLDMKIGDVEFQGDKTKAIFYYIADERVDFRELIKIMAQAFNVRIEMRQIGARQEAGRIGGVGPCGRELCCSGWLSGFVSVSTNAARKQELSLNPQKLAGQCSKLKCCLNYELDNYIDTAKDFPDKNVKLKMNGSNYFHMKTDVHRRMMWYTGEKDGVRNIVAISVDRVLEIIELNKKGKSVEQVNEINATVETNASNEYANTLEDDITRFDKKKSSSGNKKKKRKKPGNQQNRNNQRRQAKDQQGNRNNPNNRTGNNNKNKNNRTNSKNENK